MGSYNRFNKEPKTLLSENKLSAIYCGVNVSRNKFNKRTTYPFQIKQILRERKIVHITKNGLVAKSVNVRRKSKFFTGRSASMF